MVCYINDDYPNDEDVKKMTDKIIDISELPLETQDFNGLKMQRIAGGSIIEYPPVFSPNGDALFVVCDDNIRVYSTTTGEWARELEGISGKPIIGHQCDPNNGKLLYGCTQTGDIISWKWESGVVHEKQSLRFFVNGRVNINSFSLINLKNTTEVFGLVTWRQSVIENFKLGIFNLSTGFQEDIKLSLKLKKSPVKTVVSSNGFFALIQGSFLRCVDLSNGQVKDWKNIKGDTLTTVVCHPIDDIVVTGDVCGRVLLYRQIFSKREPMTTLYHWHHTPVTSIAFTQSGSNFYSGGLENTLVQWDLKQEKPIKFLPRMYGTPVHIAVGADSQKVSVATDDNGIQILNGQNSLTAIVQNFTWIPFDKTEVPKFPIGLKVNPRTSCLVLNGRIGHLQFYSTYTKSLLYNLDIIQQNRLNIEVNKVLYNLYVSHVALNMNWLATAELLDDHENTIESRLKFWQFDLEKQSYVLNTQIELPHENGIRALEFSTPYNVDNLLCATSGEFDVKIWALEDSGNYKRTSKIWNCIARTNYKNLPIRSLGFSSDTSLLGVGYGNTLCIYAPETLHLKCALSAPSGLDGSANKLSISLPSDKKKNNLAEKRQQFLEKRKKLLDAIRSMLESGDVNIVKKLSDSKPKKMAKKKQKDINVEELNIDDQQMLFDQILAFSGLNLFQKINIYDKFNLRGRVLPKWEQSYREYTERTDVKANNLDIQYRLENLSPKYKFKYVHKYNQYKLSSQRSRIASAALNRTISFAPATDTPPLINGNAKSNDESASDERPSINIKKQTTQINHVVFCAGEFTHLVIVCTENRLLIWNLLTLRLQSSFKIAVEQISIDLYTSLVAVTTKTNDLYVFLPNTPIPLYQHRNLPRIQGLAWIPRHFPKPHSLMIDWQASTELYFLSEKQELLRLVSSNDAESLNANAFYLSDNLQPLPNTPFAAMIAKQQSNYASGSSTEVSRSTNTYGIGVLGKNSVKELTTLQAHTMAPVNLMCTRFLKSLLVREDKLVQAEREDSKDDDTDEDETMHSDDSD